LSCSMSMVQNCPCKSNVVDFSVAWSSMRFFSMRRLFPIFRMCILHLSSLIQVSHCWTELSPEACLFGHCRGLHLR
jgi:hypothetical protein